MKVLDLFSGIGGFSLGLEAAGMETVAFCEIDSFCQAVLRKHWPNIPIYDDVRTLKYDGAVDVVCGGYPCQPFSYAGKRYGKEDDRHLWPEMFRIIKAKRPTWVIGENVAGHVTMGLDDVLDDLESLGYATRPFIIPAGAVGARHRRERVWVVANSNSTRCKSQEVRIQKLRQTKAINPTSGISSYWKTTKSPILGMDDGVSHKSHRIRLCGNAVVPQVVYQIGKAIMQAEGANQ